MHRLLVTYMFFFQLYHGTSLIPGHNFCSELCIGPAFLIFFKIDG